MRMIGWLLWLALVICCRDSLAKAANAIEPKIQANADVQEEIELLEGNIQRNRADVRQGIFTLQVTIERPEGLSRESTMVTMMDDGLYRDEEKSGGSRRLWCKAGGSVYRLVETPGKNGKKGHSILNIFTQEQYRPAEDPPNDPRKLMLLPSAYVSGSRTKADAYIGAKEKSELKIEKNTWD